MTAIKQRAETRASGHNAAILGLLVVVMVGFGLLMVLSSSSVQALRESGSSWLYFQRQLVWVGLGAIGMVLAARLDYRVWRLAAGPGVAASVVALVVVLIPSVGVTVNGSRRWIDFGPFQVQPSEVAKVAVLVFCADLLARRADRVHEFGAVLGPVLAVLGVIGFLIMSQPDMGTTAIIAGIVATVLFVGGIPTAWMLTLGSVGAVLSIVMGLAEPYRRARILSFIDPWADATHTGYQVVQSLVGMGSGQLTGVGIGASRAKWGFLPNAHTDFIFTIVGEELGLLGSLAVLAAFVFFAVIGVRIALRAPDRFGTLLAAGITAWVVGQAVINIGAVVGALPVTGVPLPFVSAGGSALGVTMVAAGMLVSVARESDRRAHTQDRGPRRTR